MSHIFRHDKTGNCAGRSQHNDNGNQLVLCKTASDGKGQKKSFITDQFHKGTGDGCFEPGKSFPKMKRSTHGHETKRSSSFGKIAYGRVQDLDLLTLGMVNDMYAESSNDEYKGYAQIATQRDFDLF